MSSHCLAESPAPTLPSAARTEDADSLNLALKLQAEEEAAAFAGGGGVRLADVDAPECHDPDLEASIALAIRLQQQDDDALLRAAIYGSNAEVSLAEGAGGAEDGDGDGYDDSDESLGNRPLSPTMLNYESLIRLADNVGHVARGASEESIEEMPVLTHAACCAGSGLGPGADVIIGSVCSICRMDFEPTDELRVLRCRHAEHKVCIDEWLKVSKQCPICKEDVEDALTQAQ